jgi:Zn-dependent membrane protease YugP
LVTLLWLLLLVPLFAALWAQGRVRSVFERYGAVRNRAGVTGAQLARLMLDAHGLGNVSVQSAPGFLSDHYDGAARALRLSPAVGDQPSVAALAIAAHEVSHAYQAAEGSRAYRLRQSIGEPLASLAPWSGVFFIGGFWLGVPLLMILSVAYVAGLVLFALATVPVEFGASRRAVALLAAIRVADGDELVEVRHVLSAAAWTYVAGVMRQVGLFLALVLVALAAHRVAG